MGINWFPGHMNKARREIAKAMRETDLVIEILDARLPSASQNPMLRQLRGGKPCIKVLNKSDLADATVTQAWMKEFEREKGVLALPLSANRSSEANRLNKLCRRLVPDRGVAGKPIRAMVVGIPNVGKSTLINSLKGRSVADVGNKPAVTKRQQTVELGKFIVVSDTPGVLWPKIEDESDGYRLAATGAIGANAMDYVQAGLFALSYLSVHYSKELKARYKLSELPEGSEAILEAIGAKRGCLTKGVGVDLYKAAELILNELRSGKIGKLSMERPPSAK